MAQNQPVAAIVEPHVKCEKCDLATCTLFKDLELGAENLPNLIDELGDEQFNLVMEFINVNFGVRDRSGVITPDLKALPLTHLCQLAFFVQALANDPLVFPKAMSKEKKTKTKTKTMGRVTKEGMIHNKDGKLVSRKRSEKKKENPWIKACQEAKKALGLKGMVKFKKGSQAYLKAKEFYEKEFYCILY